MKSRTFPAMMRITVATLCSFTLAFHSNAVQARVSEPEPAAVDPADASDDLPPKAQKHVVKGLQQFEGGAYSNAEEEFRRAAFFAPKWRSLHFNLGVVAEAQGKLGTALTEYKSFKPYASPEEGMVVDQRIYELNDRRRKIAGGYKSQIATSAIAMSLGVLALGAGGAFVGLALKKGKDIESNNEGMDPAEEAELKSDRTKFLYGAYFGILIGLVAIAYSFVPLTKSIKSKRQLEGLALGKTRLHWNGGAGVRLRF